MDATQKMKCINSYSELLIYNGAIYKVQAARRYFL